MNLTFHLKNFVRGNFYSAFNVTINIYQFNTKKSKINLNANKNKVYFLVATQKNFIVERKIAIIFFILDEFSMSRCFASIKLSMKSTTLCKIAFKIASFNS